MMSTTTMSAEMTTAEAAKLAAALRAIGAMNEKHREFEAAMRSGDEQAVRAALRACQEAERAWIKTPSDFEDGSPAEAAVHAALEEHDALAAAPIPWDPEDRGAEVLAAEVAEIAAANAAAGAAEALVAHIDEELGYLDAEIEALRSILGLPLDGYEEDDDDSAHEPYELDEATLRGYQARLVRSERRLVELTVARAAKLGPAGEDPLGYWRLLAKHGLMIPEWWAIRSYQQRMEPAPASA